jgi:16S rRNA (uracil1498-N3)-methyltransferase
MPRFFCSQALSVGALVPLEEHIARHIQVLRLDAGDAITLFNGEGGEYAATLACVEKKRASAEVKAFTQREIEKPYAITLAQALPEASKIEWIIEKAVELGASGFQPLMAQRCVTRLSGERAEKKRAHWQGIVTAASEQSGRNRLMSIAETAEFKQWIVQHDLHRRILLTPRADQSLSEWARHQPAQAVTLIIGPEGGFTDSEEQAARSNDVLMLSM